MIRNDELLFVVDEENNPVPPKSRSQVHLEKMWHRTSHVWILNKNKEILCQKRSLVRDALTGNWEPMFSLHLTPEVSYIDGAVKVLQDTLDLPAKEDNLSFFRIHKNESEKEFQGIFSTFMEADITKLNYERSEIVLVQWFKLVDIWNYLIVEKNEEWAKIDYAEQVLRWFLQNSYNKPQ